MEEKLTAQPADSRSDFEESQHTESAQIDEASVTDPMDVYGGYADCCGASEAEPTCQYRPPTAAEVYQYRHQR